jgi:hypothetical protein
MTRLPIAALAIALILLASPVRAETLDLACTSAADSTRHLRRIIDTDRRIVTTIGSNGKVFEDPITFVSDQFIKFRDQEEKGDVVGVNATVDRIAGTITFETVWKGNSRGTIIFNCRKSAKQF